MQLHETNQPFVDTLLHEPTPSQKLLESKAWFDMFPIDRIVDYAQAISQDNPGHDDRQGFQIIAADENGMTIGVSDLSGYFEDVIKAKKIHQIAKNMKEDADSRRSDTEYKHYVFYEFASTITASQLTSFGVDAVIFNAENIFDRGLRTAPEGIAFARQLGFNNSGHGGIHDPQEAQTIDADLYRLLRAEMLALIARKGIPDLSDLENPIIQVRDSLEEWRAEHILKFDGREP